MSGQRVEVRDAAPVRRSRSLWLVLAMLPVLYLPLRAAEAPDAGVPLPATPAADSAETSPAPLPAPQATPPSANAAADTPARAAADDDEDEREGEPVEQVSADNNLSFPVDI